MEPFKIAVFGATGGTGRQIIERARAASLAVRAFVRAPDGDCGLPAGVEIARGDARDPRAVQAAVAGVSAVVSSLGQGSSNRPTTHMSEGIAVIVEAMRAVGVERLVCVSSLGACDDPAEPFLFRTVGRWLYRNIFADHRRMEARVKESGLVWTVVRAASLTNGLATQRYRIAAENRAPGANRISRADTAHFIIEEVVACKHLRQAVALGY